MHRLDVAQLHGPATAISLAPMQPGDTVVCYVFGDGALDAARFQMLRPVLECHVGSPYEFAAMLHLGSMFHPLLLGAKDLFGPIEEQSARLDRFLAVAPEMLGAFGSWWPESFARIQAVTGGWRDAAIRICLFLRSAHLLPLEWDGEAVEAWVAGRPPRSACTLIIAEDGVAAGTEIFDDWLVRLPAQLTGPPRAAIVVDPTFRPLPVPSIRLRGASSQALAPHIREITLPLDAGLLERRLEIARFDGITPADLHVSLR